MTPAPREPWRALRDLEPPLGAKRRIAGELEAALAHPRRRWPVVATLGVGGLAAAIAAMAFALLPGPEPQPVAGPEDPRGQPARVELASAQAQAQAQAPDAGIEAAPRLELDAADRMTVSLPEAAATVRGPARLQVHADQLVVSRGRASIVGTARVTTPMCRAVVRGQIDVTVSSARTEFRVIAGSVEVAGDDADCQVLETERELTPIPSKSRRPRRAPAKRTGPAAAELGADTGGPQVDAGPRAQATTSSLRREIDALRAARKLTGAARVRALEQLRRAQPAAELRHELDAELVLALARGERPGDAAAEARAFLERYPDSPYADAFRAMVKAARP